ncbi:unnamed protein product [Trichogramma brassicae]|uniref:General transcription factor 3C polypeptide 1 n=1 Tax=Trichogramma brassicae TaxID=86971 RepID=A0A6H5IWA0_9HYME|nr:unnamed protein product [Trichogramma brassicae]
MHGRNYGYSPKFIRMKEMHIFLYYLVHDHPGICYPRDVFLDILKSENLSEDDEFLNDVKNVYSKEIGWKMFVPPLPDHRGYPKGWCLMSDVHLRMPLSMFVKLHNVNSDADGLKELLDHPIKRHMLVKDVPTSLRDILYFKRRYIFSIHELASRLCFIGLLQFGPQMLKEKDQVFVYLNQHSELLDTTSSAAGYHRVEDKPYPVTKFKFSSMTVVESYWYEMWNTCINTCLGGRSVVEGKDIILEDLSRKPEMLSSLKSRAPGEAEKHDIGFVPGDRKGAAGVDSAFFSHLKRNWNWIQTSPKEYNDSKSPSSRTSSSRSVLPRRTAPAKKRSISSKPAALSIKRASKPPETKAPLSAKKAVNLKELPTISYSKPPKIIRTVLPRKPMRKRVKYDEIDYRALQQMDKLRVDWEQHEDTILLVCKVAMVYLCPNPRRNLVAYSTIRDILRSYTFKSMNKTSRACQRRLLYMLKQPKTVNSVLLGVEELKQDHYVNKRFGQYIDLVRGESEDPGEYEKRVANIFKDLVAYVARKYYNISNMDRRDPVTLPRTIQEFNLYYKLKLPTKTMVTPGVSKEVREVIDIHTATINSVIHSSMCCGKERRSWAYQLFKKQHPERDSTNPPNEETQNQTQGYRVSDLIRRAKDTSIVNDNSRARAILPDMNDVRTRQTRIAMLQMREELHELTFQDNHHAHEYFVVNSCKMYYTLKSTDLIAEAKIIYQGMELPRTLVPLETDLINRVLNEIKNSAIFPKNPTSYDNLKVDVAQLKLSWNDVDKICKFIKAKNEFGATLHEITVLMYSTKTSMEKEI